MWFRLLKCLPGQRDGSSRWFTTFSETLEKEAKSEPRPELPSLFRIPSLSEQESSPEAGGLIHVDDMLSSSQKQTPESVVLYEQYPVPLLITSQILVILILMICFYMCRPTPTGRLSRVHSIRASASANRDGSIELSIDAGLNEGSSGSRSSPEPAYPSDTHPSASRVEPTEVVHPQAQAKAKSRAEAKSKAKAKAKSGPISPEVEARLHGRAMFVSGQRKFLAYAHDAKGSPSCCSLNGA